jgi:hypothetical protein
MTTFSIATYESYLSTYVAFLPCFYKDRNFSWITFVTQSLYKIVKEKGGGGVMRSNILQIENQNSGQEMHLWAQICRHPYFELNNQTSVSLHYRSGYRKDNLVFPIFLLYGSKNVTAKSICCSNAASIPLGIGSRAFLQPFWVDILQSIQLFLLGSLKDNRFMRNSSRFTYTRLIFCQFSPYPWVSHYFAGDNLSSVSTYLYSEKAPPLVSCFIFICVVLERA